LSDFMKAELNFAGFDFFIELSKRASYEDTERDTYTRMSTDLTPP
jgi:hypothetical protein